NSTSLPYRLVDRPGMVGIETRDGIKSPVEVSAEILATLRQRAEDTFDDELFGAVITVPAYFDDAQRQATKDAARLAGLNVLRLINEPTAAAIAYGLDNASEGLYAIYDLGGGTFDISLLRLARGVFEVVATGGDSALGGDDYDERLAQALLQRERAQPLSALGAADKRAWLQAARQAKEALSTHDEVELDVALSGQPLRLRVSAAEFHSATAALTQRTLTLMRKVLRDAQVAPPDVNGVVLVGGSTRMPQVRAAVAGFFGREPLTNLNPDEVVALGAAIQAHALAGHAQDSDLLLLDVIPLSLGLETMGGLVERIIERNTTIPAAKAQEFTTFKDGQTAMALHVVQGERELVSDCRSLARFELRGIPPMVAGAARVRVTFQVDADGLLNVSAREVSSGVEAAILVKPSYGLSDEQITTMLQESFAKAEADMPLRALREAKVDAERMVAATRAALQADADLLQPGEREGIERLLAQAEHAAAGEDRDAIEAATVALAEGTEHFAAERMNRGIRRALAGRSVEEV
ncbi:MAG TPA: Fe-S protein assembly chaperone HscA, partial [Burkholderiaceae bacterium]|nr:Fe-S protein assembly chaperone HscA [Burkholderiaceae bacterium]